MKFQGKKVAATLISLVALFASAQASAQFGKLLGGGSSTSASADPDAFLKSALAAEALMKNSVTLLSRSLSSKEKAAELEAGRKAANAITNPEEKKAKLLEVDKQELAAVNEATSNANIEADIKKMDGAQREQLAGAAFNFMLALLQDKALVEQSSSVISGLSSNPMAIGKLGSVKDVAGSLGRQISDASAIAGKMPKIFSAVGVKAPASKDEKPKEVKQAAGD